MDEEKLIEYAGQNKVEKLLNESILNHIVLQLIQSLTLCETMGDVMEDCNYVLERLELKKLSEVFLDMDEIQELLNKQRITTLYGTIIGEDE